MKLFFLRLFLREPMGMFTVGLSSMISLLLVFVSSSWPSAMRSLSLLVTSLSFGGFDKKTEFVEFPSRVLEEKRV